MRCCSSPQGHEQRTLRHRGPHPYLHGLQAVVAFFAVALDDARETAARMPPFWGKFMFLVWQHRTDLIDFIFEHRAQLKGDAPPAAAAHGFLDNERDDFVRQARARLAADLYALGEGDESRAEAAALVAEFSEEVAGLYERYEILQRQQRQAAPTRSSAQRPRSAVADRGDANGATGSGQGRRSGARTTPATPTTEELAAERREIERMRTVRKAALSDIDSILAAALGDLGGLDGGGGGGGDGGNNADGADTVAALAFDTSEIDALLDEDW